MQKNPVMKLSLSSLLGISILLHGCISPPSYPIEPQISFLSISKTTAVQLDSLRVEFSFTDGDGDLGFEPYSPSDCDLCSDSCLTEETLSIFVFDNRSECLTPFNVPSIPPKGSSDAISGKINMVIYPVCCIVNGFACIPSSEQPTDTVIFSIQLKDRAGNLSNIIDLPPVIVSCS